MGCSGNTTEACGGSNRITLFGNGKPAPAAPVTNPGPKDWTFVDCYT